MFCYTNPYTHKDIYIVLKYILTFECSPEEKLITLSFIGDAPKMRLHFATDEDYFAPKMRLHFATDEDYFAAKDHLLRKVGSV